MTPLASDGEAPRVLIPAQRVSANRGNVWLTGLVASRSVIAAGMIIELDSADRDSHAIELVPIRPQVGIMSPSGEPLLGFGAGVEGSLRRAIIIERYVAWDPDKLPRQCVFHIQQDQWGIEFRGAFINEPE